MHFPVLSRKNDGTEIRTVVGNVVLECGFAFGNGGS